MTDEYTDNEKLKLTELYFSEVKAHNASSIEIFQELDRKATFLITIAITLSVINGSIIVYAWSHGYFVLFTAAIVAFCILLIILATLVSIIRPRDISRQGDAPEKLREVIGTQANYQTALQGMVSFYKSKVAINTESNASKGARFKVTLYLLVSLPYVFLLAYLVMKAPSLLEAVHDFAAVPSAG